MAKKKRQTNERAAGSPAKKTQQRTVAENRRARHRFEILEKLECGISLVGSEVKSLRQGGLSLEESYVRVEDGQLWLIGADIPQYRQAAIWNHRSTRPRKLLVHKSQLKKLAARAFEKGMTLIPLSVYFNQRGIVKVLVGVGRGKKMHDKREALKRADVQRQMQRAMRRGR